MFYPENNRAIAACDDGVETLERNKELEALYSIPVLLHMDYTVSPPANLMHSCIVEPRAVAGCGSIVGDSRTLKSGTIVKLTSVAEMGMETEQGIVLFTSLEKK